jgi:hypothetical protein
VSPEERAARERKQKIFVVVGGIFMVVVLVFFTLPKVLSSGGSSPSSAATTETTPTAAGQVPTPTTSGVSTPTSSRAPAALATTAKLTSFTLFKPKDPFVQQVKTENGVESAGAGAGAVAGKRPGDGKGKSPATTFSTGGKAESATIVTVNGERQVLKPGMKFPSADPLFVLVAEKPGAKSVVVGIAGGAYSGGAKTTTLKVGKTLTLVNTTTGARYRITLVSVGSGDTAEQPPAKQ